MDLSDLIERNAAFTPEKTAILFEGEHLELRGVQCPYCADRPGAKVRNTASAVAIALRYSA